MKRITQSCSDLADAPNRIISLKVYAVLFTVFVALVVHAQSPTASLTGLFNTGVDDSGAPLTFGTVGDPHYALTSVPQGSSTEIFPIPSRGLWTASDHISNWIGPANGTNVNGPAGEYVYQTDFTITNFVPGTVSITGRFAVDNELLGVYLNGVSLGISQLDPGSNSYASWHEFNIPSTAGFVFGQNTLQFLVNNDNSLSGPGPNPTGLRVEMSGQGIPNACANNQTSLPSYGTVPAPLPGQDSLVFITHGWISKWALESEIMEATNYVTSMSNSIARYVSQQGLDNWQVYGYLWLDPAEAYWPGTALGNAFQQGKMIGDSVVSNGWKKVHFIAHSAGAGLIQAATAEIRATATNHILIQCTFLDPYDGGIGEYTGEYGACADWADGYFARDITHLLELTGRTMANAFNADVTGLDPSADYTSGYVSGSDPSQPCTQVGASTHGWPIAFYANSVTGAITGNLTTIPNGSNYDGFGFPLSMEANDGNWQIVANQYPVGNGIKYGSITNLGPNDGFSCMPDASTPLYVGSWNSFSPSSTVESPSGTIETSLNSLLIGTTTSSVPGGAPIDSPSGSSVGSPTWIATVVTDSNALNYVSFNAEFTSEQGSDGLLSVYWDTNLIGLIDEAAVEPGLQPYTFTFANTVPNTSHVLGFHLDEFTTAQSSVLLTNIVTGCSGVSHAPILAITKNTIDGHQVYRLTGQPSSYMLQASMHLAGTNWTDIAILADTNGTVDFIDPNAQFYPYCFYRAVVATPNSEQ